MVFRENLRHPSQLDEWMDVPTRLRYSVPGRNWVLEKKKKQTGKKKKRKRKRRKIKKQNKRETHYDVLPRQASADFLHVQVVLEPLVRQGLWSGPQTNQSENPSGEWEVELRSTFLTEHHMTCTSQDLRSGAPLSALLGRAGGLHSWNRSPLRTRLHLWAIPCSGPTTSLPLTDPHPPSQ